MPYILLVLPLVSPFLIWRGAFQNLCRQHSPALYTEYSVPTKLFQKKKKNNHKYNLLCHRYFMRSLGWGIITAATIYLASLVLPENETPWIAFSSLCFIPSWK